MPSGGANLSDSDDLNEVGQAVEARGAQPLSALRRATPAFRRPHTVACARLAPIRRVRITRARYTGPTMTSVADQLRARTRTYVLALPVSERIALALALGDDDLERYVRHSDLMRTDAIRRLQRQRAHGRRPSAAAAIGR